MILIITDDQRWDDLYYMPQLQSRLVAQGIKYRNHRADFASCVPARAEIFTGHTNEFHNQRQGTASDFKYCAIGDDIAAQTEYIIGTGYVSTRLWYGPWEFQYPFQRGTASIEARDSGSLPNWLRANGITTGLVGKYTNHYGEDIGTIHQQVPNGFNTKSAAEDFDFGALVGGIPAGARRVPPDWDYWFCHVGFSDSGGTTDGDGTGGTTKWQGGVSNNWGHWSLEKLVGSTPTNIGITPQHMANWVYRTPEWESYQKPISSISCSGTTATVITTVPLKGLAVGDEIIISGVTVDGRYNTTPAGVNTPAQTVLVTGLLNEFLFTYTLPSGSGLASGGAVGTVYHEKGYYTNRLTDKAISFINGRGKSEPWFLYIAPSASHQQSAPGGLDSSEASMKYIGTTPSSDAFMFGGVPGAKSPASTSVVAGTPNQWAQRQDMLKSVDDMVSKIDDACKARGWEPIFVYTSDQGVMYGEHGYWRGDIADGEADDFPKWMAWDPCIKAPLIIRHPRWEKGITHDEMTQQIDLPLTILDWFGLTTHLAHTYRSGVSLARTRRGANRTRSTGLFHRPPNQSKVPAMVTYDGYKFIEATPVNARAIFYLPYDPEETTNLLVANPSGTFSVFGWDQNVFAGVAGQLTVARGANYRNMT